MATQKRHSDPEATQRLTEELTAKLHQAVEQITSGDDWKAWLDFSRGFHQYSFNNAMLIYAQCPIATRVASFKTWKSKGVRIRSGETSLRVRAPMKRKERLRDTKTGEPVLDENGNPILVRRVSGYRWAPVFDISQTTAEPPPIPAQPRLLAGDAPPGLWDSLAAEVAERGFVLRRCSTEEIGGANGLTDWKARTVSVRYDVDQAQAVKTLAHELAHVMLHEPGSEGRIECRGTIEVEAESTAYVICGAHGIDTADYTFGYVTHWSVPASQRAGSDPVQVVQDTGTRVMNASAEVIVATTIDPPQDLTERVERTAQRAEQARTEAAGLNAGEAAGITRDQVLPVLADTQAYFQANAAAPDAWVPGYLDSRGQTGALRVRGIGQAPDTWTGLVDHLRAAGHAEAAIEAAGVGTRARTGNLIDRFRDRMTMPIRAHDTGDVVGFTARLNPSRAEDRYNPKYINSPDGIAYSKSDLLYGAGDHREAINTGSVVIMTEGPIDALAADRVDTDLSTVAVAPCGTALTTNQARHLEQAPEVILAFDGDAAGTAATQRAWETLTAEGPRRVSVVDLPAGKDPADLDTGTLTQLVEERQPAAIAIADRRIDASGELLNDNTARQLAAYRELAGDITRVPEHDRADYALHLSQRLNVPISIATEEATNAALHERAAALSGAEENHLKEIPPATERGHAIALGAT